MGLELLKPVKVLSKGPSLHVPEQIKDGFKMIQVSNIRPYYYCYYYIYIFLSSQAFSYLLTDLFGPRGRDAPRFFGCLNRTCHCPCPLQSRASHPGYASIPHDPEASVPHERRAEWNPLKMFKTIISQTHFHSFSLELYDAIWSYHSHIPTLAITKIDVFPLFEGLLGEFTELTISSGHVDSFPNLKHHGAWSAMRSAMSSCSRLQTAGYITHPRVLRLIIIITTTTIIIQFVEIRKQETKNITVLQYIYILYIIYIIYIYQLSSSIFVP